MNTEIAMQTHKRIDTHVHTRTQTSLDGDRNVKWGGELLVFVIGEQREIGTNGRHKEDDGEVEVAFEHVALSRVRVIQRHATERTTKRNGNVVHFRCSEWDQYILWVIQHWSVMPFLFYTTVLNLGDRLIGPAAVPSNLDFRDC